ncbi:MAG: DUF350 domain-containing protein [SAR86 cluster bacterium]|jgi:uncharacterized membrane protein YjfL (UPF0719 family)|tara:strand:+ start:506 stop:1357 length:852 start_codon:yes stop_codon:yes gene_type:complete
MNIEQYGIYILYTLIYVALAVVLKYALNLKSLSDYNADEQLAGGNLAVGLRRIGAQFGLAIAVTGVLSSSSGDTLLADLVSTALYGLVAVMFILSSLFITDRLVLPGINNQEALKQGNMAVGFVELGMLVATGIVAYSSMVGEGGGMLSSLSYFIAGQITLVALVIIYEKVFVRNFDIVEAIGNKNVASGIYLGGKMIAYSLILKSAIAGNGSSALLADLVLEFLAVAALGMLFLYLFEYLLDRLIVTSANLSSMLSKDSIVPVMQLASAKIGIALILSNAIL